ncbi:Type II inositol 1,4,5-trisphosphate 5-phosphatase [Armadillidium nasatum]|uniref:Type II inositol 1,4,5-trisphosphate 5-phosphatase n=1 Tax=Armadillidium nasatum TaxID=96803 RepID=A0A5N5THP0_9CRUS|nr:Type II inositol 1,4,5-trisphosphate 5-phosphatase [Armadillidium nasatum]
MVTWKQLVGVALFVFVQEKHAGFIRDVSVETVKTGMQGATGNKGGVGIRMVIRNTSMAFICSHFAAGQKEVNERNSDYDSIARKLIFNFGVPLWAHDYVFWCGDFNYRINLPREEVIDLIQRLEWGLLLEHDQLRVSQKEGKCFKGFIEGDIAFAPTYKYDLFSDDYDTSEKCRIPAWTDRVLFWTRQYPWDMHNSKWTPGNIVHYGRAELKQSDHRPVLCIIDVVGRTVVEKKRDEIYNVVVESLGPTDCSIVIKVINSNREVNVKEVFTEKLYSELKSNLDDFGDVVMIRLLSDSIVATFKEATVALNVASSGLLKVGGYELAVSLKTESWKEQLQEELALSGDTTVPLVDVNLEEIEDSTETHVCLGNVEGVMEQLYIDDPDMDGLDQPEALTPTAVTPTQIDPIKPARPAPPRPTGPCRPPPPKPTPPGSSPASPALNRSDKFEPIDKPPRPAQLFSPNDIDLACPNGMFPNEDFPDPPSTFSTPSPPPPPPEQLPLVPSRTPSLDSPFNTCTNGGSSRVSLKSSQTFPSPPCEPPPSLPPSGPPPSFPLSESPPLLSGSRCVPLGLAPSLPPPGPPPSLPPRSPSHVIKPKDASVPPIPSRTLPPIPARNLPPIPPRK